MGFVLDDKNNGIHCETRNQSAVLFTDFGDMRIEMNKEQIEEAIALLKESLDRFKYTPTEI